jgi:hypothetical protein
MKRNKITFSNINRSPLAQTSSHTLWNHFFSVFFYSCPSAMCVCLTVWLGFFFCCCNSEPLSEPRMRCVCVCVLPKGQSRSLTRWRRGYCITPTHETNTLLLCRVTISFHEWLCFFYIRWLSIKRNRPYQLLYTSHWYVYYKCARESPFNSSIGCWVVFVSSRISQD